MTRRSRSTPRTPPRGTTSAAWRRSTTVRALLARERFREALADQPTRGGTRQAQPRADARRTHHRGLRPGYEDFAPRARRGAGRWAGRVRVVTAILLRGRGSGRAGVVGREADAPACAALGAPHGDGAAVGLVGGFGAARRWSAPGSWPPSAPGAGWQRIGAGYGVRSGRHALASRRSAPTGSTVASSVPPATPRLAAWSSASRCAKLCNAVPKESDA